MSQQALSYFGCIPPPLDWTCYLYEQGQASILWGTILVGQCSRYKDVLKRHLKAKYILIGTWKSAAQDRQQWRQAIYQGETYGGFPEQSQVLEEENDHLENSLREKVKELKVVSIKIGNEVRSQNDFLHGMENDFDNTGGFLQSTMSRVTAMAKAGHNRYIMYLFMFSLAVFFVIWLILKLR